jgi:L-malate glycosyltransferase
LNGETDTEWNNDIRREAGIAWIIPRPCHNPLLRKIMVAPEIGPKYPVCNNLVGWVMFAYDEIDTKIDYDRYALVDGMKISVITNWWENSNGGGVKTFVVNLVDALKVRNEEVSVLFREGKDPGQFYGGRNKVIFTLNCYRQLKRTRPDVVHSHGAWFCLLPGVIYRRSHRCVLIHTFHSEPLSRMPFPARTFFQGLLKRCDCVTFVSKRLEDRVKQVDHLTFKRTAITYPGIRMKEVTENDIETFRERFGIKEGSVVLLAQGMTAHQLKADGLRLLIQAVKGLRESYPNIVLIATRNGRYSEELMAFAKEIGIDQNIVFTGDLENPFIPLRMCDLYTHITLGDGLPLALLEAMAMGKPIVATSVGGLPEALMDGKGGLLVEPEVGAIIQKIDLLLRNPEMGHELGVQAKRIADERFTWDQATEKFLKCYSGQCE